MADNKPRTPIAMTLPPEILTKIGSYIHRKTLPSACRVCKIWLVCLRPLLWRAIRVDILNFTAFVDQFPHYHEHVRYVSLWRTSPQLPRLLGVPIGSEDTEDPQRKQSNDSTQPSNTLLDCRNLLSLVIKNDTGLIGTPRDDPITLLIPTLDKRIVDLIAINKSTLQELSIYNVVLSTEPRVRELILEMPHLESLALEGWDSLTSQSLFQILRKCSRTLKKLSLEMNELAMPFWELRDWRMRWDLNQSGNSNASNSSATGTQQSEGALTTITTLILNRCTVSTRGLLDLLSVMPGLQELSLRDSSGIGEDDFDGDDMDDDDDDDDEDDDDEDYEDEDEEEEEEEEEDDEEEEEEEEDDEDEEDEGEGEEPQDPGIPLLPITTMNLQSDSSSDTTDDSLPDLEEQDPTTQEDEDMPDLENATPRVPTPFDDDTIWQDEDDYVFDPYVALYDDYDHTPSHHPVGLYDDDGNMDPEAAYFWQPHFPSFPAIPMFFRSNHRLFGKMRQLQRFCPLIQSFDFSLCRSDHLDESFFAFVCELWGPHGSVLGHSGWLAPPGTENSSGWTSQTSPGLKALMIRDVCAFSPDFFGKVLRNCASTLTTLDLSMSASNRWTTRASDYDKEIANKTYFNDILKILATCPGLEVLHVEPYPVDAQLIASRKEDWVCTRLRSLRICIEFDPIPTIPGLEAAPNKQELEVQIKTCQQLGRLVHLEHLHLEGGRPVTKDSDLEFSFDAWTMRRYGHVSGKTTRRHLTLSLHAGLKELAGLEALETLDLAHLGPHALRNNEELEWLGSHWPMLTKLDGLFDRAIIKKKVNALREELGPDYTQLMNTTEEEKLERKRYEEIQKKGVPLPLDLVLSSHRDVLQLQECRKRNFEVDYRLVEKFLAKEGMFTTFVSEEESPLPGRLVSIVGVGLSQVEARLQAAGMIAN
ncbi:hypothetical protein BGX34_002032 [Mortierella sp. NVP85]|nr:hypothetical protein BGX34_002032 [Mortierella sp. NVP85]